MRSLNIKVKIDWIEKNLDQPIDPQVVAAMADRMEKFFQSQAAEAIAAVKTADSNFRESYLTMKGLKIRPIDTQLECRLTACEDTELE